MLNHVPKIRERLIQLFEKPELPVTGLGTISEADREDLLYLSLVMTICRAARYAPMPADKTALRGSFPFLSEKLFPSPVVHQVNASIVEHLQP